MQNHKSRPGFIRNTLADACGAAAVWIAFGAMIYATFNFDMLMNALRILLSA
jgi:hypothetical protein